MVIKLCILCDIKRKDIYGLSSPKNEYTKKNVVSVDVSVSWSSTRLGSVDLVNLEKELLAVVTCQWNRCTYFVTLAPFVPVVASLRHHIGDVHIVDKVVWAFKYRPDKASRQMPRDVAVERPDAGVVLIPLQDDVRVGLELGNVTPGRVGWVGYCAVPAGTELLKSLASNSTTDDTASVVVERVVKSLCAAGSAYTRVAG